MDTDSTVLGTASKGRTLDSLETLQRRASTLWSNAKGLVNDHTQLALLEVQRASLGLVKIIAAAVVISVLAVTAWMALVTAGVVWAVGAGASWAAAIVVAAVLNTAAAVALALWIKAQVPEVLFAATLRQLRGEPPEEEREDLHAQ
jgi:uncharacterized membrane protein YqjE